MSARAPPPPPHHPLDGSAAFEPRTNTKKNHLGGSRTDKRSEIARALTIWRQVSELTVVWESNRVF